MVKFRPILKKLNLFIALLFILSIVGNLSIYGQQTLSRSGNQQNNQTAPQLKRNTSEIHQVTIPLRSTHLILKLTESISSSNNKNQRFRNSATAIVVTSIYDDSGQILLPKGYEIEITYNVIPGKRLQQQVGEISLSIRPVIVEFENGGDPNSVSCIGVFPGVWELDIPSSVTSATNSRSGRTIIAGAEGELKDRKFNTRNSESANGTANSFSSFLVSIPGGAIIYGIGSAISGGFKFLFGQNNTTLPAGTSLQLRLDRNLIARFLAPPSRIRPLPNVNSNRGRQPQ
jgi:hypothetical protein